MFKRCFRIIIIICIKKGIEKGIEKGKIESAKKMLLAGIERKEVARILEIGENEF